MRCTTMYFTSDMEQTRHGKRAAGVVVVSIPMSRALREEIKVLAKLDGRTAAAWARHHLQLLVRRSRAARKAV